jgi:prolyl-tRNA synthetase
MATIEDVSAHLGVHPSATLKAMAMVGEEDGKPLMVLVRGDHRLNEIKLQNHVGRPLRQARDDEIGPLFGSLAGYMGPVGCEVEVLADSALELHARGYVCGANRVDEHLRGVEIGRDFTAVFADVRCVEPGDTVPGGGAVEIVPAIEIGNIFRLGTRYSEALGATYLDEDGVEHPIVMGSYGIGPARIAAAAVEQLADESGIVWPKAIAPFDIHVVAVGKPGEESFAVAEQIYEGLLEAGVSALFDDREAGPGSKFADAELLGCPVRVTVGRKAIESGEVELQLRDGLVASGAPLADATRAALGLLEEAR